MIKQTYSVYVQTAEGTKKWHLSSSGFAPRWRPQNLTHDPFPDAYWTQETLDRLLTVDDIPELRSLDVPPGIYLCARTNRMRETVSRSTRNLFPDGSIVSPPSSPPAFLPYPSQRRPDERRRYTSSPLSPSSPTSSQSTTGTPCVSAQGQGLSLAPLEVLEECRRFPRDPTDVLILKSFNRQA
jgi:hypothetical protein